MPETERGDDKAVDGRKLPVIIRFVDGLSTLFAFGAAIAVVLLAVSVFFDVIGRTIFHAPLTGTLEMTAYWWMPMLTLLAFAFTERQQEHIKVTILLDALPLRMRQIVEGSFSILATGLLVALTWYTLVDAMHSARIGETTPGTPPVAIWPFKFVAVAGAGMLSLQFAATSFRYFAGLLPQTKEFDSDADIV